MNIKKDTKINIYMQTIQPKINGKIKEGKHFSNKLQYRINTCKAISNKTSVLLKNHKF